ncbi:AAA family ATPase [Microbacterium sp. LRZ72]|uniref:nucleotide-binding protein n=1 Tax=Microbacterium sp. LRZ72 TaxID=2942481 RepID=UPI0029A7AEBA|nr:AAA family ATPase [Microbacterium sp. LRZ72]MDX2377701.1 AAA family ATPase [Microbacterium sp. LRZ72]
MTTVQTPRAYATVTGPTATYIAPDGHTEPVTANGAEDIRHAVVRRASADARTAGIALELVTSGDRGTHRLLIDTTGTITAVPALPTPRPSNGGPPTTAAVTDGARNDASATPTALRLEPIAERRIGEEVEDGSPPSGETAPIPDAEPTHVGRPSFITPAAETPEAIPGWRGVLVQLGIAVPPSARQQRHAGLVRTVSRQWAGCRSIAVANGKGGVGKTMTTAMLAAAYARWGGGNVLAWDNNDTRGTLGWRTETGLYDTTVRDLLPTAEELLTQGAGVSDISRFVHHQGVDRYDVLRSNPELLATDQRIVADQFDLLMQVAARYYRLVVFDSGNDESADRWLRMIDSSHQLVIPTLAALESAESAALLLDALRHRDDHSAALAENAVVIVTQAEPGGRDVARIADGFVGHVRAVHTIPYDRALKSGPLRFDTLHPRTQNAWLSTAASVAKGL